MVKVDRLYRALVADLMPHMMKEEQILFPYVSAMDEVVRTGQRFGGSPFGTVKNPIRMMEVEHEAVGEILGELRATTGSFTTPEDACNTYRGLYHGLVELERELVVVRVPADPALPVPPAGDDLGPGQVRPQPDFLQG